MKNKFKVGDRVRIRQWDDMVKEFGLINGCRIPFTKTCGTTFTVDMKHLCGRTATITRIYYDTEEVDLAFDDNSGETCWYFFLGAIEGEKANKQERIKELKKQIEEINAEINKLEQDDILEQYESDITWRYDGYILNERGCINEDNDSIFNATEYNPYHHYMTEEYANKAAKIKKFNDMLMAFMWCYDRDYEPDFSGSYDNRAYYVYYDSIDKRYDWCFDIINNSSRVYFSSKEIAQKCADWLNDIDPNGELVT